MWKLVSRYKRRVLSTIAPRYVSARLYQNMFGKPLDLKKPRDINEKLQYLKLYTYKNNSVITQCSDKYRIREYIHKKGMEKLLPKLYGVYDKPSQIEWDKLPDSFMIKCNHGSGYNILCSDKKEIHRDEIEHKLKKWLKEDYWKEYGELQYKYIKKKIIIEEYLGKNIYTYKFYCFNGKPKVCYISSNGENGEYDKYIDYFDMQWNRLGITLKGHDNYPGEIECPKRLEEMIRTAEKLSEEFPFVRVDLYNINGNIYISELTFIPTGGFMSLEPSKTSEEWGGWLKLD